MKKIMKRLILCIPVLLLIMGSVSKGQVKGNYKRKVVSPRLMGGSIISESNERAPANYRQQAIYGNSAGLNQEGFDANGLFTYGWEQGNLGSPLVAINDKQMVFQVNALLNAKADAYLAIFNLTQLGESASEADSLLNRKVNQFISKVGFLKIEEKDVATDIISLKPIYEFEVEKKLFSKTYTEVPKGFELQKNIHVRFKEASQLDQILTMAAESEIYDLVTVDYFVDDTEGKYSSLRKKAIETMNAKLKDFEALGIKLDTVYHKVQESRGMVMPIDRYKTYQSYQSTALQRSGRVEVNRIRKPETYFYEKLPYEHFDVVVNPEYLEPVVQYVYTLKLKYVVEPPKKKVETHHIMVTPEGVVKTLKVD